jgi:hypothetical protein
MADAELGLGTSVAETLAIDPVCVPNGELLAAHQARNKHCHPPGARGGDLPVDQILAWERKVDEVAETRCGSRRTVPCDIKPPHERLSGSS